jgi:hypothetical protein
MPVDVGRVGRLHCPYAGRWQWQSIGSPFFALLVIDTQDPSSVLGSFFVRQFRPGSLGSKSASTGVVAFSAGRRRAMQGDSGCPTRLKPVLSTSSLAPNS